MMNILSYEVSTQRGQGQSTADISAVEAALEAAAGDANVDATAHALRHFYASALIAGGASVKQVQTVLGHASALVTLRTYAHLWPGDDDRTRSIIDAVFGALADQVRTDGVF